MRISTIPAEKRDLVPWLVYIIAAVAISSLCAALIEPQLMHHIQQTGFYTDHYFITRYLSEPGGGIDLATLFFTQFFYSPAFAAVCITLMLLAQSLLLWQGLKRLSSSLVVTVPLSIIPSMMMLPLLQDYRFPYAVITGLTGVTVCLLLVGAIRNKTVVIPVIVVLGFALFHVADSGYFTLFIVSSAVILLFRKNRKRTLVEVSVLAFYAYLFPLFLSHFVYNLPPDEKYTRFLAAVPVLIQYKPGSLFYAAVWSIPVLFLLVQLYEYGPAVKSFADKRFNSGLKRNMWIIAWSVLIMAGSYILVNRSGKSAEKKLARIDYETAHGNWENAVKQCLRYDGYNIFVNFHYNLSCMMLGNLPERFFDYPQLMGEQAMFPDKVYSGEIAAICSDFYYQLGYVSEARHWAYEAQTLLPYSPAVLKRLVLTNLICGNYEATKDYLRVLSSSPVEKNWAEKYWYYVEDTMQVSKDPALAVKRKQMPLCVINHNDMDEKYRHLLDRDSTNVLAWQCMMLYSMLGQRMGRVVKNYEAYGRITDKKMPDVFDEACLLYFFKMKRPDMSGFAISNDIQKRFIGMNQIVNKHRGDKNGARKDLYGMYGNTYLYYILYYSPLVTKASVTTRVVDY